VPDALAEKYIDEGNYADAIKRLEEIVDRRDDPGLRLRLATCQFREGKLGDALVHSRRVAEVDSEHREDALLLVAWCLRSLRRWRESSRTYLEFSEKFPASSRIRIARFGSEKSSP
jgi:tetratricopeptide (TPR) repeat protein